MLIPGIASPPLAFGEVDFSHPDPDGGTRRAYAANSNPDYIDNFGWTLPVNPFSAQGWKQQIWIQVGDLEVNAGHTRTYQVWIGGVYTGVEHSNDGSNQSGRWVTISNSFSGAVTFHDNIDDGETAHTGIVTFAYRYTRA
jgi:hypothetical protein